MASWVAWVEEHRADLGENVEDSVGWAQEGEWLMFFFL